MSTTTASTVAAEGAAPSRGRALRWPWIVSVVLAAILLFFANVEVWAYRNIATTSTFVDTATNALEQEDVRDALATRIVDRLLEGRPLLQIAAADTLTSVITGVLGSDEFEVVLRGVATQFHQALTKGEQPSITIQSQALQLIIAAVVKQVAPDRLTDMHLEGGTLTIDLFTNKDIPSYESEIKILRWAGIGAGIVGLFLLALPAIVRRDRWSIRLAGFALLGMTLVSFLLMAVNHWLVRTQVDNEQAKTIISVMLDHFVRALVIQTGIIMVIAAVVILIGYAVWPFSPRGEETPAVETAPTAAPA
jgi:hypothetical protein